MTNVDSIGEATDTALAASSRRRRIDGRRVRGVPRQPRMDREHASDARVHTPTSLLCRMATTLSGICKALGRAIRTFDPPCDLPPYLRIDDLSANRDTSASCSLLFCGDAKQALRLLPKETVQTVVTSPPYWSLRDYDVATRSVATTASTTTSPTSLPPFDEVKRVLRHDGTVWLNAGDVYTSGNRRYRAPDRKNRARAMHVRPPTPKGLKPKDLIGVPWRMALMLQEAGWWIRSEVVWHKPNAHPESVGDRPTKAHETVFLLSKSQNYYYDVDAVRGPNGRRLRSVWDIPTEPVKRQNGDADDHPRDDAHDACTQVRFHHQSRRQCGARSICRIRNDTPCRSGTRTKMDRRRAESCIRRLDRTSAR